MGGEFAKNETSGGKSNKKLINVTDNSCFSPRGADAKKKGEGVSPPHSPVKTGINGTDKLKRRNEKIVIFAKNKPKASSEKKVLELIQKNNKEKKDYDMLFGIIDKHFFMQNLTKQAKDEIIITMSLCRVKAGNTLFKQGTIGSYWYIISEGDVEIYVDDDLKKTLSRGASFGEIALMNDAPRTATIKAKTDVLVWVLKREAFRKVIDFLFQMNYEENMKFLNSIELPLENSFKTLLANNLLEEFYKTGDYICKKGEDGNCMFIIKQGEVNCVLEDGTIVRTLTKGDNFGQKAILFEGKRTINVVAKTDTRVYSISVEFFKNQLGDNYKEVLFFSFILMAFQKSKFFNNVTEKMLVQIHEYIEIRNYGRNELIFKKGEHINKRLCIALEGNISDKITGKIYAKRCEFLFEENFKENKDITAPGDMIANPDCLVAYIDYEKFKSQLGGISSINTKSKKENSFKKINLFRNLGEDKLEMLENSMKIEKFENGKKIIVQGETGDKFYIIKSGRVDFFVNYKYVRSLGENEEFGARSLIIKEKRSATAISNGKVEVYSITSEVFKSILEPKLVAYFQKKFSLEDTTVELSDLDAIQELGKGNFGFVYLVKSRKNKNNYAIKAMNVKQIKAEKLEPCVELEKNVLLKIDHPFIMKMIKYMKNDKYIFFLDEYIHGKELWEVIRDIGLLTKEQTQFYAGSVLLAIEYLHKKKIIYRDIKPENIMVGDDGFTKVIDFGTVKEIKERTNTIIGTPHYMAPEIVKGEGYSFQVDVWSIAICMYEFFCGRLPFGEEYEDPMDVYQAVSKEDLTFPSFVKDDTFISLLTKLLKKNPLNRLTKISKIKEDPYFKNLDWQKLISFEIEPPYRIKFEKKNTTPLNVPYLALLKSMEKNEPKESKRKPSARQLEFDKWLKKF